MSHELAKKYRPETLTEVLGQDKAVAVIEEKLRKGNWPKASMLCGPSGTGKTTLARIIGHELGCVSEFDFNEINVPQSSGVDMIRDIAARMYSAPAGKCRVYYLDECHALSNKKGSGSSGQQALLKMLEDPPRTAYFILATTAPDQLIAAIKNRCTTFDLKSIPANLVLQRLKWVAGQEKIKLAQDVIEKIVEVADGSLRQALTLLDKIMDAPIDDQMELVQVDGAKRAAFDIVRALLWENAKWKDLVKIIKDCAVENNDREGLRLIILTCAAKELLKITGVPKTDEMRHRWAYNIIAAFEKPWYACLPSGLEASCYDAITARK